MQKRKISHDRREDILHYLKTILTIISIAFIILACFVAYRFGRQIFTDSAMTNNRETNITYQLTIKKGESALSVGTRLEEAGIIESRFAFWAQAYLYEYTIGPGEYTVESSDSSKEIGKKISSEYLKTLESTK